MKKSKKLAIIFALVLIAVGLAISFRAMAAMDFNFTKMNTLSFVTNSYHVEKAFLSISVDGAECNVRLLESGDGSCRVVCNESDKISHSITVENNTLVIERHDKREWYEHMGIYWGSMEIIVYLPQSEFAALYVKTLSGDIVIPEGFSFEAANIRSTSGDVSFLAAVNNELSVKTVSGELYVGKTAAHTLNVKSTSGNITVEDVETETALQAEAVSGNIGLFHIRCQTVTTDTSSGETGLANVIADESIHIESVSGDVALHKCDANALWIKTSSGDVSGSLLTEKIFFTDTSSGDVNVPQSASGGKCEIQTSSGNIEFDIE